MSAQSFRYEFTTKELIYFLFKKKVCPKCGEKMKKEKCGETVDGSVFNTNSIPLYIRGRDVKLYYYAFICPECGAEYKLSELVQQERRS